jgi:SAM-dependent methyltransferase
MALWPEPGEAAPAFERARIEREVTAFARGALLPWEAGYLEYHGRRYQDTLRLLPEGRGRRLLDVGSFPGHLSVLAQIRGWEVTGLNSDIENLVVWTAFLDRCRERKIEILTCEVEQESFPVPTAAFDAVLFCELLEHLYRNPFHTLKEIFRVLRPGGVLILTTPNLVRAETLFRYLHGWGTQPPMDRAFGELFPSLLYHRHNREYTGRELDYLVARQGKDLYDFRLDRVYYSDCLDFNHELPGVTGQRPGRLEHALARGLRRLVPRTRNQLMVRAWRPPATLIEWGDLTEVEGVGPLQEDEKPNQGFTRRLTFPFRLTASRAAFRVLLPAGDGPVCLSLMAAHPAPADAPALWTRWTLDGHLAMTLEFRPHPRPVRLRLLVPGPLAAHGSVRVGVETSTWGDPRPGVDGSLHVGGQWILAERLADRAALDAILDRVQAERRAEESLDGTWWHAAAGVYVEGRITRAVLDGQASDEAQLGPGWHAGEDWGRHGTVRWSGPEAIAYLAAPPGPVTLGARVYSGHALLGPVTGAVEVAPRTPDGVFAPLPPHRFALPPDTWADLTVAVPRDEGLGPGPVRVTLRVDAPRVPRQRIPESTDSRSLGVAVGRLALGRAPAAGR